MEQETLTRNESADLLERTLINILADAPRATQSLREMIDVEVTASDRYQPGAAGALHDNHVVWLEAGLNDEESLALMEKLAARLRYVGQAALVEVKLDAVPWRD